MVIGISVDSYLAGDGTQTRLQGAPRWKPPGTIQGVRVLQHHEYIQNEQDISENLGVLSEELQGETTSGRPLEVRLGGTRDASYKSKETQ